MAYIVMIAGDIMKLILILPGEEDDYRGLIEEFSAHEINACHFGSIDEFLHGKHENPGMVILSQHCLDGSAVEGLKSLFEASVQRVLLVADDGFSEDLEGFDDRVILKLMKNQEFMLDIEEIKGYCKQDEDYEKPAAEDEEKIIPEKDFDPSRLFKSFKKLQIKEYGITDTKSLANDEPQLQSLQEEKMPELIIETTEADEYKPKVAICSGHNDIDEGIASIENINVIGITKYKSEVYRLLERNTDFIVLSNDLEDSPEGDEEIDILDIIHSIKSECEVIFINFSSEDAINIVPSKATLTAIENMGAKIISSFSLGVIEKIIFAAKEEDLQEPQVDEVTDEVEQECKKTFVMPKISIPKVDIKVAKDLAKTFVSKANSLKLPEKSVKKNVKASGQIKNVIGVTGCRGVGKTFVATNLAWRLAECGYKTVLVDGARDQDVFTWLQLHHGEKGLVDALNDPDEPEQYCYSSPRLKRNLFVLTSDPLENSISFDEKIFWNMILNLSKSADFVVIDLEGSDSNFIRYCNKVLLIADTDEAHILRHQKYIEQLENKGVDTHKLILVVNKYGETISWATGKLRSAVKLQESFLIPYKGTEIQESIHHGIPASEYISDLMLAFFNVVKVIIK